MASEIRPWIDSRARTLVCLNEQDHVGIVLLSLSPWISKKVRREVKQRQHIVEMIINAWNGEGCRIYLLCNCVDIIQGSRLIQKGKASSDKFQDG